MALMMIGDGNSRRAIIDFARTVGFEDVYEANVEELFQSKFSEAGERTK
jgi:hypothetical protein